MIEANHRRPEWLLKVLYAGSLVSLPMSLAQGKRVKSASTSLPEAVGPNHGRRGNGEKARPVRVVVIGDSTVSSVGVSSLQEGVAARVAEELVGETAGTVAWWAIGKRGATARRVRERLVPQLAEIDPDLVIVLLGVNDTTRLARSHDWRRQVKLLVDAIHSHKRCPIIFSQIPPVGLFPAIPQPLRTMLGLRAQSLDAVLESVLGEIAGAIYCPVHFPVEDEYVAEDGFHPSALGYAEWGRQIAASILSNQALRRLVVTGVDVTSDASERMSLVMDR